MVDEFELLVLDVHGGMDTLVHDEGVAVIGGGVGEAERELVFGAVVGRGVAAFGIILYGDLAVPHRGEDGCEAGAVDVVEAYPELDFFMSGSLRVLITRSLARWSSLDMVSSPLEGSI